MFKKPAFKKAGRDLRLAHEISTFRLINLLSDQDYRSAGKGALLPFGVRITFLQSSSFLSNIL